jgi:hypothetical protein
MSGRLPIRSHKNVSLGAALVLTPVCPVSRGLLRKPCALPQKANAYVNEISRSLVACVVDEGLVEKLRADFEANGVNRSDEHIREKTSELMAAAVTQVRSSTW